MWVSDEMKERARRVDLIQFLEETHPDLIFRREAGEYAVTKRKCITFFKGQRRNLPLLRPWKTGARRLGLQR